MYGDTQEVFDPDSVPLLTVLNMEKVPNVPRILSFLTLNVQQTCINNGIFYLAQIIENIKKTA